MRAELKRAAVLAFLCGVAFTGAAQARSLLLGVGSVPVAQAPAGGAAGVSVDDLSQRSQARPALVPVQWGGRGTQPHSPIEAFFSALFGGIRPPSPDPSRTRILITPAEPSAPGFDTYQPRGGSVAYCVRTCDGRFFPLGARVERYSTGTATAQCQAMCPAAEMALFTSGGSIDTAVNDDGVAYADLPAAYVFRKRLVEGCSCNSSGKVGGLRHVDIKDDATLRRGDVVMTVDGPKVFAGNKKGPPFRDGDFVAPSKFPKLPKDLRQRLNELSVASR